MKVEERLLKYIAVKTPCDENSDTVPTSQCQFDLARILADELKELGLDKVVLDDKCFVYGILAATPGYENKKKLGLIAHMDTVPEFCEAEIHPVCTPDYDGCDLVLEVFLLFLLHSHSADLFCLQILPEFPALHP